jgi:hypothetical protein
MVWKCSLLWAAKAVKAEWLALARMEVPEVPVEKEDREDQAKLVDPAVPVVKGAKEAQAMMVAPAAPEVMAAGVIPVDLAERLALVAQVTVEDPVDPVVAPVMAESQVEDMAQKAHLHLIHPIPPIPQPHQMAQIPDPEVQA